MNKCIFAFSDFRLFLKSHYRQKKNRDAKKDSRRKEKGWKYLRLVIDGRVSLNTGAILSFADALDLSPLEAHFLVAMVKYNQTGHRRYKEKMAELLTQYKKLLPSETSEIVLYMKSI